jgi:hypothetical protein
MGKDAAQIVQLLRSGNPAVAVAPHRVPGNEIGLELTGVEDDELGELCILLEAAITSDRTRGPCYPALPNPAISKA